MSFSNTTIATSLAAARRRLGDGGALEAEVLLAHVLGKSRTFLHTWPERTLAPEEQERFEALMERRRNGEPVAYLIGRREFWSMELEVNEATLIPRPDTELLVEEALARIPAHQSMRIADLGSGSGAVALAIARERPLCEIVATDLSPAALVVATANAHRLGLNVIFRQGRWFAPLASERFHVIASNPPYIAESDPHLLSGDLPFEPRSALAAGADGLDDLRQLVAGAPAHLEPGGWLLLEHGYDQGEAVRDLMNAVGFDSIETKRDLENRDRVTLGQILRANF